MPSLKWDAMAMNDSLFFLLKSFFLKETIPFNFEELKLQLLSHPSYPSLHAITGVLDHFNIENLALEVPQNVETLKQLPQNFISLISNENSKEFAVVTQKESSVVLLYGNKKKKIIPLENFLTLWDGVIVIIEKDTLNSRTTEVSTRPTNNNFFLNSVYFISILLIVGLFFVAKPSLFQSVHFILSLVGVGISLLIVIHELGYQSKAVAKFCTATETTSCDAVLNSKGASISKHFKLSDVSFIYFIGLALSWVVSTLFLATSSSFIILTLIALPITLYSIYYQFKVVKKWCPLCMGIVGVLWLQCCSLFLLNPLFTSIKPDFTNSFILFFSLLVTASLWLFIKPLLKKQQDLEKLEIEHIKFKRNFDFFYAVYNKSRFINMPKFDSKEIVLGSKNASLPILIVTNPACFYCKSAHADLEKILNKYPDTVSITIRFNVPIDKDNVANQVANRLLEIYNTKSIETFKEALHEAYKSDADLNKWIVKWEKSKDALFNGLLEKQQTWCHENSLNFTPALFINGRQFPKEYDRSDLNYFIDDLIELAGTEIEQHESVEILN